AKWHKKRTRPLKPDSYPSTGFDKEPFFVSAGKRFIYLQMGIDNAYQVRYIIRCNDKPKRFHQSKGETNELSDRC
ncbi:hypothetical protein, partial [uncultured Limosilactobacillus sp.]|uniref:hypothetical protein n=1 Tax=uncultured Limosilactobacillus sp. TaxID=2837629 RepID=UPI0025FEA431